MDKKLLDEFRFDLYQTLNPDLQYHNMIGLDHLIKGANTKTKYLKEAINKYYQKDDFNIADLDLNESVEMQIAYFGIGLKRLKTFREQMEFIYLNRNVPLSWMTTDLVNQYLKKVDFDIYLLYAKKLIKSSHPYAKRFAYVIGLKFYRLASSFDKIKELYLKDDNYYVMMAIAWNIAEYGISSFDDVIEVLKSDLITYNTKLKAISKMIDSFRISDEKKMILKNLRIQIKGENYEKD